jgi:uncharacterized protein (DUF305 family)
MSTPHGASAPFSHAMHEAMAKMSSAMAAAQMNGDVDHDFLAMMIPHHAGAVDMARLLLIHGHDPLVRQLAEEIIASQQAEIASMEGRLAYLHRSDKDTVGEFPVPGGTRGPVERGR